MHCRLDGVGDTYTVLDCIHARVVLYTLSTMVMKACAVTIVRYQDTFILCAPWRHVGKGTTVVNVMPRLYYALGDSARLHRPLTLGEVAPAKEGTCQSPPKTY